MIFLLLELKKNLETITLRNLAVDARENLDDGFNNGVYAEGATTSDGNTAD